MKRQLDSCSSRCAGARLPLILMFCCLLFAGCGQKGDLFLPGPTELPPQESSQQRGG